MNRREFVTVLGGATAWPLAAHAQQPGPMRRIGVLMPFAKDDAEGQARVTAFIQELQRLGCEGRNLQIEYRWETSDRDLRKAATELAALSPDVSSHSPIATGDANRADCICAGCRSGQRWFC